MIQVEANPFRLRRQNSQVLPLNLRGKKCQAPSYPLEKMPPCALVLRFLLFFPICNVYSILYHRTLLSPPHHYQEIPGYANALDGNPSPVSTFQQTFQMRSTPLTVSKSVQTSSDFIWRHRSTLVFTAFAGSICQRLVSLDEIVGTLNASLVKKGVLNDSIWNFFCHFLLWTFYLSGFGKAWS